MRRTAICVGARLVATTLAMAMSITVAVSAPIQAGLPAPLAGGETKLAGVLPAVESAMLRELIRAGVSDRVVLIEAATNGHLTLARVSFTYSLARSPEPLVALLLRATAIARASLASSPSPDQVHLSGFYQEQGPFDGNRRDATFTAAYRRQDLPGLPNLTRMWMHPALEQANPDALASRAARSAEIARLGVQLETQPAFSGTEGETSADLERRLEGLKRGGLRIGVLYRGSPKQRDLALTFDDGPEPLYTTLLLDTLSRLGLKATFFLIGERVEQFPYLARDIVEAGHELGNHSFHHRNLTRLEPVQVDEELQSTQVAIERATGVTPRFFRPPGGRYNATTLRVAAARRLITIFWTDDPGDYLLFRERVLKMRLLGRVGNGGILLLHTGVDQTIQVLPEATQVLRDRGYALGPVSTLLRTAP